MGASGARQVDGAARDRRAATVRLRAAMTVDDVALQTGPVAARSRGSARCDAKSAWCFRRTRCSSISPRSTTSRSRRFTRSAGTRARAEDGRARAARHARRRARDCDAFPRQLSGGEAQRVAIARALAPDPMMLLMDEPTAALDPARRGALGETLRELAREGRGLLVATHDVDFARDHADRVIRLADGRIAESSWRDPHVILRSGTTQIALTLRLFQLTGDTASVTALHRMSGPPVASLWLPQDDPPWAGKISLSSCAGTTSSCANVQSRGGLSLRHRRKCAVCRKRLPCI